MQNNNKKWLILHILTKKKKNPHQCLHKIKHTTKSITDTPQKATKNQTQPHIDTPTKIEHFCELIAVDWCLEVD